MKLNAHRVNALSCNCCTVTIKPIIYYKYTTDDDDCVSDPCPKDQECLDQVNTYICAWKVSSIACMWQQVIVTNIMSYEWTLDEIMSYIYTCRYKPFPLSRSIYVHNCLVLSRWGWAVKLVAEWVQIYGCLFSECCMHWILLTVR